MKLITKKNNFVQTKNVFVPLYKLIAISFFKSFRGPFFMYVMPGFFLTVFYNIFKGIGNQNSEQILFTYLLLPALTIITSMSQQIAVWKNSIFLRRLETTGISKLLFLIVLWIFYLSVGFSGLITQFLFALINDNKTFITLLSHMNWGWFILGFVLTTLLSISIASTIGGAFGSEGAVQGVSMMIYFIIIFMSGIMLPISIVETNLVIKNITYILPQKYSTAILVYGLHNKFTELKISNNIYHDFTQIWQPILGSVLFTCVIFVINVFTFKWSVKN